MKHSPLFSSIQTGEVVYDDVDRATYKGITIKTFILLGIAILIAAVVAFALPHILVNSGVTFIILLFVSSIVGFIAVIVGRNSETKAKYASVIYSICEGLFLGSISAIVEAFAPGAVATAVFSTVILFAIMLTLFATGVVKYGSKLRTICFALTMGALALTLLVSIFALVGILVAPSGMANQTYLGIMIAVEVFLLIYGVITLSMNFAEANAVVAAGASKGAEWSVALGLLVSIVYIYIEVLRLIFYIAAKSDR